MAKLTLQFHAESGEVFTWVAAWAQEMDLFVAVEVFVPEYRVESVDKNRLGDQIAAFGLVRRVSLSVNPIDTTASSSLDFMRLNPDILTVSIGAQIDGMLRESAIAAMTEDATSLNAWKAIRNSAKGLMRTGPVAVINPTSGARRGVKSHYYSRGAQELSRRGFRMLAAAGWNEFEFDR